MLIGCPNRGNESDIKGYAIQHGVNKRQNEASRLALIFTLILVVTVVTVTTTQLTRITPRQNGNYTGAFEEGSCPTGARRSRTYGGNRWDDAISVEQTADGGYYGGNSGDDDSGMRVRNAIIGVLVIIGILVPPLLMAMYSGTHDTGSARSHRDDRIGEIFRKRFIFEDCGTTSLSYSKSCPDCGASSLTADLNEDPLSEQEPVTSTPARWVFEPIQAKICMVCALEVNSSGDFASCPRCGSDFHKTHLLEWIRKKKCCPVCGEHLDRKEITG